MNENLGVLIYDNAQPMDIIGPWEVFSFWKNILPTPIKMYLISESGSYVHCINEIILKAHVDFDHAPTLDYLLVPGGPGRLKEVNNARLISFLKTQALHCQYILSDCTGMFLLQKAGLLKNQSATTYWRALPELKSFSDLNVVEERVVKSGKIWTAGGVSSGIDLALALIAEVSGSDVAGQVQLLFEYFPNQTLYATLKTVDALPPYQGNGQADERHLAHYIKEYLQLKK